MLSGVVQPTATLDTHFHIRYLPGFVDILDRQITLKILSTQFLHPSLLRVQVHPRLHSLKAPRQPELPLHSRLTADCGHSD